MSKNTNIIPLPPYTFGVEIECVGGPTMHPSIVAYELRQSGFTVRDTYRSSYDNGYDEDDEDYDEDDDGYDNGHQPEVPAAVNNNGYDDKTWVIGADGSVQGQNTMEIKSPILKGQEGLRAIRRLCAKLVKLGVTVNRSCGLHVHVGVVNAEKQFHSDEILMICKRYHQHQEQIDKFLARSRTGSRNEYCRPLDSAIQNLERTIARAAESPAVYGPEAPPSNWRTMTRAQREQWINYGSGPHFWHSDGRNHMTPEPVVLENVASLAQCGTHYDRVSVAALGKYGTIEFRQHHGTVNGAKITNWIRFLLNHVEVSRMLVAEQKQVAQAPLPKKARKDTVFVGLSKTVRKHFKKQSSRLERREQGRVSRVEARRAERQAARDARQAQAEANRQAAIVAEQVNEMAREAADLAAEQRLMAETMQALANHAAASAAIAPISDQVQNEVFEQIAAIQDQVLAESRVVFEDLDGRQPIELAGAPPRR